MSVTSESNVSHVSAPPPSPAQSRILTVSPSIEHALVFINSIHSLGASPHDLLEPSESEGSSSNAQSRTIPWTISNKYYSADVHFQVHDIKDVVPPHAESVPAVIFVWSHGEPYRHHIQRLADNLTSYEPEVSLAVRIRRSTPNPDVHPGDEEQEDDSEIDEFLSSHGFEFIDALEGTITPGVPLSHGADHDGDEGGYSEGIPGLPRVIDALSTIMWPSMQALVRKSKSGVRERELFDWARTQSLHSAIEEPDVIIQGDARNHKMQRELKELTLWLEGTGSGEHELKQDPWKTAASRPGACTSPTEIKDVDKDTAEAEKAEESLGFEDDFTVFVSAPPLDSQQDKSLDNDGDHSFEAGVHDDALGLPAGSLYHSLGSVSDFGDYLAGDASPVSHRSVGEEEPDEDLPTRDEIEATSARIFGASSLPHTHIAPIPLPSDDPLQPGTSSPDEDYDMAPFDLSRVLSALEGMKAEIAGMEDDGERRRAAAKVALGLVYGLEQEAHGLEPQEA